VYTELVMENNPPTAKVTQVTTQSQNVPVSPEHPQKAYAQKKVIFRAYQIIWYILGIVEVLLGFRIVLKMLAANPTSPFVNLVYNLSDPLALPFRGIFSTTVVEGAVFEWSTIIAGLVYALVAYGLVQLFQLIKPTTPAEVQQNVDSQ
jgi:uncharacterized protein YggT (Ycf19 family)